MEVTTERFRIPEQVMLTRVASAAAEAEWPFTVALVPINYLMVDERYQRPRQEAFIKAKAAEFDESLVGVLDIAPRRDDRFAVMDGRQRLGMMEIVGKTAVWCAVYPEMTLRDEAEYFYKKNQDRKTVAAYYKFRARVVAEESVAVRVLSICHGCGFDVGPMTNHEEVIGSIKALENAYSYSSDHRDESLTPTLMSIRDGFYGRQDSTNNEIIRGLARFWQKFDDAEIDRQRLAAKLSARGPQGIMALARDRGTLMNGPSKGWQVAWVIAEEYNKGERKGNLDLKRLVPSAGRKV